MATDKKTIRALVVDDHALVRRGLRDLLDDEYDDVIFGEAATAQAALEQAWREPWDVVILDLTMPGRSGLDVLQDIADAQPNAAILVQSMHTEDQFAIRALRAGAAGYITKMSMPEELIGAIETVLRGEKYISATLAQKLALVVAEGGDRPAHESLSDREFQVLRMLAAGHSVTEIGHQLSLSFKTISTYRTRLLEKLRLQTNADLVLYVEHHGLGG